MRICKTVYERSLHDKIYEFPENKLMENALFSKAKNMLLSCNKKEVGEVILIDL